MNGFPPPWVGGGWGLVEYSQYCISECVVFGLVRIQTHVKLITLSRAHRNREEIA